MSNVELNSLFYKRRSCRCVNGADAVTHVVGLSMPKNGTHGAMPWFAMLTASLEGCTGKTMPPPHPPWPWSRAAGLVSKTAKLTRAVGRSLCHCGWSSQWRVARNSHAGFTCGCGAEPHTCCLRNYIITSCRSSKLKRQKFEVLHFLPLCSRLRNGRRYIQAHYPHSGVSQP
jgi:hypothetical protein